MRLCMACPWRASSGKLWANVLINKKPATGVTRPAANKSSWTTWPVAGATPFSPGSRQIPRYDKITCLTLDSRVGRCRHVSWHHGGALENSHSTAAPDPGRFRRRPRKAHRSFLGFYQPRGGSTDRRTQGGKKISRE